MRVLLVLLMSAVTVFAEPVVVNLWPGVAPGSEGVEGKEKERERGSAENHDRAYSDVHVPSLTVHLPPKGKANGAAVIICPGGGYGYVVTDKEGSDVARWLNELGVAGIVLKYRLPFTSTHRYGKDIPIMDARRAIRTVRHRAEEWNLNPDRIGIMGFSAGGHLASTAATHLDAPKPRLGDAIDGASARPDFAILVYPVISLQPGVGHSGSRVKLLGKEAPPALIAAFSNELRVTEDTPPNFLAHALDDGVKAENSKLFHAACEKAGVSSTLKLYANGGHGYGIRKRGKASDAWPADCAVWLKGLW